MDFMLVCDGNGVFILLGSFGWFLGFCFNGNNNRVELSFICRFFGKKWFFGEFEIVD